MKWVALISSTKFTREGGREKEEEWSALDALGEWGVRLMRVWGRGEWLCSFDAFYVSMQSNKCVGGVFLFLSGNQSVQRLWAHGEPTRHVARRSLSWGRHGESSDLAQTFSGHQRGMGAEEETFSAKWKGARGDGRGNHPSEADLKLERDELYSLRFSLDKYSKHGFCINIRHFRGRHGDKD